MGGGSHLQLDLGDWVGEDPGARAWRHRGRRGSSLRVRREEQLLRHLPEVVDLGLDACNLGWVGHRREVHIAEAGWARLGGRDISQ